ncbi:hypothetical protein H5410_061420, partial [Solanum commersonii]
MKRGDFINHNKAQQKDFTFFIPVLRRHLFIVMSNVILIYFLIKFLILDYRKLVQHMLILQEN